MKALRLKIWQQQLLQTLNKFMKTRIKEVKTNRDTEYTAQIKGLSSGIYKLLYLIPVIGQFMLLYHLLFYRDMEKFSTSIYNFLTDAKFDTLEDCKAFIAYYTINGHVPPSTVTETVEYIKYKIIK